MRAVDQADEAARRDPELEWRAGWMRYVVASDTQTALKHWEAALQTKNRAWALAGLAETREDLLDTLGAAKLWAQAIAAAPEEPVAELAAVRLLDVEGESPAIDDVIVATAAALKAPVTPRTSRLVREAAARIQARRAVVAADPQLEARAWQAAGAIQHWRVGGPYAALRLFDLAKPLALDGAQQGRAGGAFERALDFPDGDVGFEMEPGDGDVYYAASHVTAARGGKYLLWVEGAAALEVRIDGDALISRVPYPREMARAQVLPVTLDKGAHDVLVRWSRAEGGRFRVALVRGDGDASDVTSEAPAQLEGARKSAACALGVACAAKPAWTDRGDLREWAQAQPEDDALAAYFGARAALGDDRALARAFIERAQMLAASGAPALALHGQELLHDPEVPERIARGRALADFVDAVRKNPRMVRLHLTAAALERDSERFDDAAAGLDKAEGTLREILGPEAPLPARLLVSRARLLDARGNGQGARAAAQEALKNDAGRCDALQLASDIARREGSVADQDRFAKDLAPCPDTLGPRAQLLRERGDLAGAETLLKLAAALRPAAPSRWDQLAEVQAARKELPEAMKSLAAAALVAPRSPEPLRRLAGMQELAGDPKAAIETRRRALRLAPGDLALRRQVGYDDGALPLRWADRDAVPLAKAPMPPKLAEGASAVRILDYGAVEMYPDGGGVERVHTLVRVLDKQAIGKYGEAQIPSDAIVVHLRNIKQDGRILEPESIPEKEGISIPGLEAGDAIDMEYDHGIGPRGPELPGWTLAAFYFRDDETPMVESSYELRSATPFEADAHNLALPPGAVTKERFHYTAQNVTPLQSEPHQPPEAETMPWVQLGTGAGQKELTRSVADWALLRARPSSTTEALARAAGGSSPREISEKVFAAVSQAIRGRSQSTDFSAPAAHVLAQGRGNRLLVLKAALLAVGVRSHIVLVRPFGADPAAYRFPRGDLYSYAVLRIDLPDGPVWADPSYRLAPFGQLPTFVRGASGWVVPEPGEEAVAVTTPSSLPGQDEGRDVVFDLKLGPDGAASGTGRDTQKGFEAASLKDVLERLDQTQRKQAVESMLGRGLHGLELKTLATEHEAEPGGAAVLIYGLDVQLARKDSAQLFAPATEMPLRLARRWASKADRQTPLLIDSPEKQHVVTRLTLPPGTHLRGAAAPVKLQTPFGAYAWSAREENGVAIVDESVDMPQERIAPAQYAQFAEFARTVDQTQAQELLIAP